MKKIIVFLALIVMIFSLTSCLDTTVKNDEIIRIHIRANSNSETDQNVKYKVKDAIVAYITPLSQDLESKEEMYNLLESNLEKLRLIAVATLESQGYEYGARIYLGSEEFPLRSYDGITFESGVYDSLIIELGTGDGDNWWCVAYPPLCFIGAEDNGTDEFKYKSKILEILSKE